MAINYTISYTFSPGTTISSSQVNTNFSDNVNTWNGLEALTKTFAKLKVDVDPATALEVATKQYVDHYSIWRRPVLQYSSGSVVVVETGIDGTSGELRIVFPDGSVRTDSTNGRIQCNLAQVAALSGTWQSGIRTGTVSNNTWYSFYAVKTTDDTAKMVIVADTVIPTQANFATLNSNFGTNGWVYIGTLPNGDNSGTAGSIPKFAMAGNKVTFYNQCVTSSRNIRGVRLANTAGATSVTWSYASGTALGSAQVPGHILIGDFAVSMENTGQMSLTDSGATYNIATTYPTTGLSISYVSNSYLGEGLKNSSTASVAQGITLSGYIDGVLGPGANPLL